MACFLVPTAEAIAVAAAKKVVSKKEEPSEKTVRIPMSVKLKWLNGMLVGGSFLLAFEHVWHGEVAPWFPFLTAMSDPADAAEMFHEMATVGVTMAVIVTLVWAGICIASDIIVKRVPETSGAKA
ncbi:MAG: hypothetical protein II718_01125 [Clostridiales bacterium]|nr:hypothetical protein [Clostridiales bacterium]